MEETETSVWPSPEQVLEEISAAGYDGTELGPYGYYPTEAQKLRGALASRGLTLTSAFVPLRWFQPDRLAGDIEAASRACSEGIDRTSEVIFFAVSATRVAARCSRLLKGCYGIGRGQEL